MTGEQVIFRVFRAKPHDVLALFPDIDAGNGFCQSYQHIGQHGGADYEGCINSTRPATPSEYTNLADELRHIGYTLSIRRRRQR